MPGVATVAIIIGLIVGGIVVFIGKEANWPNIIEMGILSGVTTATILFPTYVREGIVKLRGSDLIDKFLISKFQSILGALSGNVAAMSATAVLMVVVLGLLLYKAWPFLKYAVLGIVIGIATRWIMLTQLGIDPSIIIDMASKYIPFI